MSGTSFLEHPGFKYSFQIEGYKNFTFGAATGPTISLDNLFHEMGHAIDFVLNGDDLERRVSGGKFNFDLNLREINGQFYETVETNQCTLRECRATAIQMKLMHMVGFKTDLHFMAETYSKLTVWLPDWYLVEGGNQEQRIDWCKNYILKLYHEYEEQILLNAFKTWLDFVWGITKYSLMNETKLLD